MNPNWHPYVPNQAKWIKYYDSAPTSEHPYNHNFERCRKQTGGSIGKIGENTMIPIETLHFKSSSKTPEVKVELISPAQQVVEQAVSEIQREKNTKRKECGDREQSTKVDRRRKKQKRNPNDVNNQF